MKTELLESLLKDAFGEETNAYSIGEKNSECLGQETVQALAENNLTESKRELVIEHLSECNQCCIDVADYFELNRKKAELLSEQSSKLTATKDRFTRLQIEAQSEDDRRKKTEDKWKSTFNYRELNREKIQSSFEQSLSAAKKELVRATFEIQAECDRIEKKEEQREDTTKSIIDANTILKTLSGKILSDSSTQAIVISLGTCNTLAYVHGRGIVLNEPSKVVLEKGIKGTGKTNKIAGWFTKNMLGKKHGSISTIRPLWNYIINNLDIFEVTPGYFLRKSYKRRGVNKREVIIPVPLCVAHKEKEAVLNAAKRVVGRKIHIVDELVLSAAGAGLPTMEPKASMIVDIGGGKTSAAVISLGNFTAVESWGVGGNNMDKAIVTYLKETYNLLIDKTKAEQIKIEIGSVDPLEQEIKLEITGNDIISNLPRTIIITRQDIYKALKDSVNMIVELVKSVLLRVKPELSANLTSNGICLVGGGSLLRGIDTVLSNAIGIKVWIANDPTTCVVRGISMYIEKAKQWQKRN